MRFSNKLKILTFALSMTAIQVTAMESFIESDKNKNQLVLHGSVKDSSNFLLSLDQIKSKEISEYKTQMVNIQKKEILGELELNIIAEGLSQAGHMIYLAYLGMEGFGELKAESLSIHDKFGKLCGKSKNTLKIFSDSSKSVQENLYDAVFTLFVDKESDWEWAKECIVNCATIAETLSNSANSLAQEFDNLADQTVVLQQATVKQQGITEEQKLEIKKAITNQKAEQATLKEKIATLTKQRDRLKNLFDEAKEEAKDASDKAFAMAMVSAILDPIASGLGAAANIYVKTANPLAALPGLIPDESKVTAEKFRNNAELELEDAKRKYSLQEKILNEIEEKKKELQLQLFKLKEEKSKIDNKITELNQKIESATDKEKETLNQYEIENNKTEIEIQQINEKIIQEEKSLYKERNKLINEDENKKNKEAAIVASAEMFKKAAENAQKRSEGYTKLAEEIRKEKTEYLKALDEKERQESEALGKQAELSVKIIGSAKLKDNLSLSSTSLVLANGALSKVTVALRQTEEFWNQMGSFCKNLGDKSFGKDVERFSKRYNIKKAEDPNISLGSLVPSHIQKRIVEHFAGWRAVEEVSNDFSNQIAITQKQVWNDFQANLHGASLYQEIERLGEQHFKSITAEIGMKRKAIENRKEV